MKNNTLLLIATLFFSACNTFPDKHQSNNGIVRNEPESIIDSFFSLYKNDPILAIDSIYSSNKYISKRSPEMDTLKLQLQSFLPQIGDFQGYNLITKNAVSTNYVLYSYIVYYDRQPLRFNFVMYHPPNKSWQLQYFQYDVNLTIELKESSKLFLINKIYK